MLRMVFKRLTLLGFLTVAVAGLFVLSYSNETGLTIGAEAKAQMPSEQCIACLTNCALGQSAGAPPELVQACFENCYRYYCNF